jgi:hypothetical protein
VPAIAAAEGDRGAFKHQDGGTRVMGAKGAYHGGISAADDHDVPGFPQLRQIFVRSTLLAWRFTTRAA